MYIMLVWNVCLLIQRACDDCSEQVTYDVCIQYVIQYIWFSLVFIPVPMSIPLPHILLCAAYLTLQVPLSFLHSTFSGSSHCCMSLSSALVYCWTVYKRLNELPFVPSDWEWSGRLTLETFSLPASQEWSWHSSSLEQFVHLEG
jgi:hypothetical protein